MSNDFFENVRYASADRTAHTEFAGGRVTWLWAITRDARRGIRSMRSPTFTVASTSPDTCRYVAAVRGGLRTGTDVVR